MVYLETFHSPSLSLPETLTVLPAAATVVVVPGGAGPGTGDETPGTVPEGGGEEADSNLT